jgi:hypothetical protein
LNGFDLFNMIVNSKGFEDLAKMSQASQKSLKRKSYVNKSRTSKPNTSSTKSSDANDNNGGSAHGKLSEPNEQHGSTFTDSQTRCSQSSTKQKASVASEHKENTNVSRFLEIDSESVLKGLIYSEILGRPKALRRHRL